ncbi:MAG: hypothetical protein WA801_19005 [Pseudolabrys sp.]
MKPAETDISDPFSQLETAGEILGFVFRQCTEAGLRQLFSLDEAKQFPRELLEDAAAEVAQAGMLKASAIVADAAKDAPIRVESCPLSGRTPLTLDLGIEVRNGIGTGSRTTPSARCVNNNSRNQRNFNLLLAMILNLSCRCGRTR